MEGQALGPSPAKVELDDAVDLGSNRAAAVERQVFARTEMRVLNATSRTSDSPSQSNTPITHQIVQNPPAASAASKCRVAAS